MNNNLAMESKADESKEAAYCYAWEIEDFLQGRMYSRMRSMEGVRI